MTDRIDTNEDILSKNFIIATYEISSKMEDKADSYTKGASSKEKDLEEMWKLTNKNKQQLQQQLAHNYKIMAYVSAVLLITSLACPIAGTAMSMQPGASESLKQSANLLMSLGSNVSDKGNQLANNLSQSYMQSTNSQIETLTQNAQKVWEADKRTNESRKEELKNLKEKINQGTQSAIDKTSMTYSYRG